MKTKKPQESQIPAQETMAKNVYRVEHISPTLGSPTRLRSLSSCEIDRQLFAGTLSPEDHAVLAAFSASLYKSGMYFSPRSTVEPSSTTGVGSRIADRAFTRALRMKGQMEALRKAMTLTDMNIVLDALLSDRRVKPKEQVFMSKAAMVLAEFY